MGFSTLFKVSTEEKQKMSQDMLAEVEIWGNIPAFFLD